MTLLLSVILGSKDYVFHACMDKHEVETRHTMRKELDRAEFEWAVRETRGI